MIERVEGRPARARPPGARVMNFPDRQDACGGCRERLGDYLSGEVGAAAVWRMRQHLVACASCAAELAEARRVRLLLRRAVRAEAVPARLARAISRAIREA